jgi:nucleotide-binding universal stress UspA family protein
MAQDQRARLRRIVAASDLSEDSDRGLHVAASLASGAGAELHVFHCVSHPVFPYWEGVVGPETREQWIRSARTDLEWQVRRVLGDEAPPHRLEVAVGEPAREIASYADTAAADLLVVGPHEPRAVFDDLLGTTADRLIRTAAVPCLVANKPLAPPLRQVLLPVDFSAPSEHAVAVAMDLLGSSAFATGPTGVTTVVEILFVSAFAASYPRPLAVEPRLSAQVEAARARLPADSRARLLPRILSAPMPVDGIGRAAERMGADLIVMGTHGYGTLGRALVGSVASAVARTLPFPVLLVPPPGLT